MSEVIDTQAVDSRVEELIASAPRAEIVETKEEDLSPEDVAQVEKYMSQIDIKNSQLVLQYGAAAQKNVADFSEGALASVKTKDMGEIGSMLTGVVTELKGFSVEEEKGGFLGLFKKGGNQLASLKAKYDKAEVNVNKICKAMEGHQQVLLKDVAMLDKMYDENLDYFKQLSLYIIAGKKKLDEAGASAEAAARRGYVDDIIEPDATRKRLIAAFEMLATKVEERPVKKHFTF